MNATPGDAPLLQQLDHVVLAVHALAPAIDDFRSLGFTVVPGGEHPGRSSHNALVVFDDGAYIEIIAWRTPAPEERWWRSLQAHGEGLVDHALLPRGALGPALAAAQARGLDTLRGPVSGGRARPDGLRIKWESARHDTADVPFLCADLTPRAWRVPEGAARRHANGATGIAALAVASGDLASSRRRWQALLGPQIALHDGLGGLGLGRCGYTLGGTDVTLFGPDASATAAAPAADAALFDEARRRLDGRDADAANGPFALRLRGIGLPRPFEPGRCHGASIGWQS